MRRTSISSGRFLSLPSALSTARSSEGTPCPAGDATEHNAGFDTVFEELHFEMPGGFVLFEVEVIGSGGKVRKRRL